MSKYLFHIILITFAVGVAFRSVFPLGLPEVVWILLIGLGLLLVWRKNNQAVFAPQTLILTLVLFALALGILRTEIATWSQGISVLENQIIQSVTVVGTVVREPDLRARTVNLYTKVGDDLLLVSADRHLNVSYGDTIEVAGTLKRPESFTSDLGREFNYPGYLLARGVEYQISFADVTVSASGEGNILILFLLQLKHRLMIAIEHVIPEPQAGLGEGLLLGVKQALGEDLETAFRQTGIIHIVVLSGYNVMLIVAFVMYFLAFIFSKRVRTVVGILAIVCFALIVGLSATVVRASIMACLLLIAQAFGRTYDVLRALLLAGAVMVFFNPYLLLFDIGFQLSFMATVGLVLVAPTFETLLAKAPARIGIKDFLVATIATQIAVLPLILYYIGEISLIAVVVNVLVLPAVPLAMLLTFAAGVVGLLLPAAAVPVGFLANLILEYIIIIATWFAKVPFASVAVPAFPVWGIGILYAVIIGFLWWYTKVRQSRNEFDSWTIEIEEDTKIGMSPGDTPTQINTPIFFR